MNFKDGYGMNPEIEVLRKSLKLGNNLNNVHMK